MTRAELFVAALDRLKGRSVEARLDATRLIEHVLKISMAEFIAHDTYEVTAEVAAQLASLVARRSMGEPVAYLCGEAWFFGRRFAVDARALVPRPETELLIEHALAFLRGRDQTVTPRIADIGTGSGAIAVTLALECPESTVVAVDASLDALVLALDNAAAHCVQQRVAYVHSDLLGDIRSLPPFDLLAANLPYLRSDELPRHPDPTAFEPVAALDGGRDGIELYRRLFPMLEHSLRPGACVLLEAAPPTMPMLAELAERTFPAARVTVEADYSGADRLCALYF